MICELIACLFSPSALGRRWLPALFLLVVVLIGCGAPAEEDGTSTVEPLGTTLPTAVAVETTPDVPLPDLILEPQDVSLEPQPLRAGFPFTVTATIHNPTDVPASGVPLTIHISAAQEEIGYSPFVEVLTVTVPASQSVPVMVPVDWNLSGGEYRVWVQVNRLPEAWQSRIPLQPEADVHNNMVLLDVMVDAFDAYTSELCAGRTDVELGPADVLPEPDQQRVLVRVHNLGNRAVYNLPVVVLGEQVTGITYTPAIPPCGGTAEVYVALEHPFEEGESLTVMVNPQDWENGLPEDRFDNNQVTVMAGLGPEVSLSGAGALQDYDFSIAPADVATPQLWILSVTVHNLGTRDASMVPIRIENEAGRKLTDAVPLVRGEGLGVTAVRIGYLWVPGGTLTVTVNPPDMEGAYPETNRDDNVATFTLP
jgi:hypothetical protein